MKNYSAIIKAVWEVVKDFGRWCVSAFMGWFVPNGAAFVLNFFAHSNIKVSPEVVTVITVGFKYLDFWWHRYNSSRSPAEVGVSKGIIPF